MGERRAVRHGDHFKPQHARQVEERQVVGDRGILKDRRRSRHSTQGCQKRPDPVNSVQVAIDQGDNNQLFGVITLGEKYRRRRVGIV